MRLDKYEGVLENIEYMLWIGMKVGEIQAVYPQITSETIHRIGKKLGINTRISKDNTSALGRNNETIKKFLKKFIEENRTSRDVSRILLLVEMIDSLEKGSTNGRNYRKREVDEEER